MKIRWLENTNDYFFRNYLAFENMAIYSQCMLQPSNDIVCVTFYCPIIDIT